MSPGVLRRGAPGVSRHGAMGFRGAAQGFRGTAPRGFEARRHGVSRGGATALIALTALIWRRPSRSLVIRRDLEGQRSIALTEVFYQWRCPSKPLGAAPRNPLALPLETPAPPLKTPWRCASKPQVRRASKPLGTNFENKIFKFWWFLGPSN